MKDVFRNSFVFRPDPSIEGTMKPGRHTGRVVLPDPRISEAEGVNPPIVPKKSLNINHMKYCREISSALAQAIGMNPNVIGDYAIWDYKNNQHCTYPIISSEQARALGINHKAFKLIELLGLKFIKLN